VATIEPQFYRALCTVLGRDDLNEAQWDTNARERTRSEFAAIFRSRTLDEWVAAFDGVDTCFAPVHTTEGAVDDPQLRARGMVTDVEHPRYGNVRALGSMLRFDGESPSPRNWITQPGDHTHAILLDLGYGDADITSLRDAGAVN
jgi:crotonobetainyl-CoA:carnitine CoA-transferase CaiB-like acyl-CoA transferase